MDISQQEAEGTMRALARVEGIFAGPSSGGAISAALRLSARVQNATIVAIVCDRGDRYLSTGKRYSHNICVHSMPLLASGQTPAGGRKPCTQAIANPCQPLFCDTSIVPDAALSR